MKLEQIDRFSSSIQRNVRARAFVDGGSYGDTFGKHESSWNLRLKRKTEDGGFVLPSLRDEADGYQNRGVEETTYARAV